MTFLLLFAVVLAASLFIIIAFIVKGLLEKNWKLVGVLIAVSVLIITAVMWGLTYLITTM